VLECGRSAGVRRGFEVEGVGRGWGLKWRV
jgi:hypothetical protein